MTVNNMPRDYEEHLLKQSIPPYKLDKRKILTDLLGYMDISETIDVMNENLSDQDRLLVKKFLH
jgi:hypothetical protein